MAFISTFLSWLGLVFILHFFPGWFGVWCTLVLFGLVFIIFYNVTLVGLAFILKCSYNFSGVYVVLFGSVFILDYMVGLVFGVHCCPFCFGVYPTVMSCLIWCTCVFFGLVIILKHSHNLFGVYSIKMFWFF